MDYSKVYKIAPQMQTYNNLEIKWKPFIMSMQETKFRSEIVNTDDLGLRFNDQKITKFIFDRENQPGKKYGAIIGSSSVFGVGCSRDSLTIPSLLSESAEYNYFNLGVRSYSGFQEIILFNSLLSNLKKIEEVIILSGVNDLFLHYYINNYDKFLGPMFFLNQFNENMSTISPSLKKYLIDSFSNLFFKSKPDNKNLKNNLNRSIFEVIERNLCCWANIKSGMKIKLSYFLQPMANWCRRELSDEENIIFNELDKGSLITNNCLSSMNLEIYYEYKNFLIETCKKLNINFFDCNEYLSDKEFNKKWLFVDRVHLTDLGNEIMSQFIKSKI
tara:strand:- start:938 stop:1927 length:990 start_codon:yes stop_codon:yes gene_type:complete